MNDMMLGAIAFSNCIASLFFLRFWKQTQDRLFLMFSIYFGIEGINRVLMGLSRLNFNEEQPVIYFIRFVSYLLIVIAILDKNRTKPKIEQ